MRQCQEVIHENNKLKEITSKQQAELEVLRREAHNLKLQNSLLNIEGSSLKDLNVEMSSRCRELDNQLQKEKEQVKQLQASL